MDELHLFEKERRKRTSEALFARMRKRIEIEVVRGPSRERSEAFSLSFLYESPKEAMHAAARLASLFIEESLMTREHQSVGTSEFLESQLRGTKARLEVMEQRIKDYKIRHMGELPQQMEANLRMLAGLQDRLRTNETSTRTVEERKVFLEAQISLIGKFALRRIGREREIGPGAFPGSGPGPWDRTGDGEGETGGSERKVYREVSGSPPHEAGGGGSGKAARGGPEAHRLPRGQGCERGSPDRRGSPAGGR